MVRPRCFFVARPAGVGWSRPGWQDALVFSPSLPLPCEREVHRCEGIGCEKESIGGQSQISSRLSPDAGHRSTRACDAACKVPT
jgi:hypothetical protein